MRITITRCCLVILMFGLLMSRTAFSSVATYRLTVINNWTLNAHPINYPSEAHFSWLGGGTHDASQSFWELGGLASPGLELMAETGVTTDLVNEITAFGSSLEWQHWFCQPTATNSNCGTLIEEFTIDSTQPLVTLTSMLGPSPDWFIGVSGLNLQTNGSWADNLVVPLALYDAGTEDGFTPTMSNPETSPLMPISLISYNGATGQYLPSTDEYIVGSFTFDLVNVSEVPIPAAMWLFTFGLLALIPNRYIHRSTKQGIN